MAISFTNKTTNHTLIDCFAIEQEIDKYLNDNQLSNQITLDTITYAIVNDKVEKETLGNVLSKAIQLNHLKIIEAIMIKFDINITNQSGQTPLMQAIIYNNYDLVKYLLVNRADINLLDELGWNALMHACNHNNLRIVNLLINHCSPDYINYTNPQGITALKIALNRFEEDKRIVAILIIKGAKTETAKFLERNDFLKAISDLKFNIIKTQTQSGDIICNIQLQQTRRSEQENIINALSTNIYYKHY